MSSNNNTGEKVQEQIEIIEQEFKSDPIVDEVIIEEIKEDVKKDVKKEIKEEIKVEKPLTKQEKDQKRKQEKAQKEQEERNAKLLEENKKAVVEQLSKLTELTTLLNNTLQKIQTTAYTIARNDLCVGYMHEFLNKELKVLNGVGESWIIWLNIEQNLLMVPQFPVEWFLNKTEKEDRIQMQLDTAVKIQNEERKIALECKEKKSKVQPKWGPNGLYYC